MNGNSSAIQWAPRVSREKILELYVKTATGNRDEALIDEIAAAFYDRCTDIVRIYDRRFACPECHEKLPHPHPRGTELLCSQCGWRMPWQDFYNSFQGRQLSVNADVTPITRDFLQNLPDCTTSREKMILIDGLIHACHALLLKGKTRYGRPLAVNFIEGTMKEVVAFLMNLPDGPDNLPEMAENVLRWRQQCLSLFSDAEKERDKVDHLIQTMPYGLKQDIEELIRRKQHYLAMSKLEQNEVYAEEMLFHRGTVARRVVRLLERKTQGKER